ncbi:MAG: hypothetical protein P0S96_06085 [Simkaniaceae bacterium]|nr:hypothetical protein [Candidatus Sacchlamyda saccharinae]
MPRTTTHSLYLSAKQLYAERACFDLETLVQTFDILHAKALEHATEQDDKTLRKMEKLSIDFFARSD